MINSHATKAKIMGIFALISYTQVKKVYDMCDAFIDAFHSQKSIFDEDVEIGKS
jgi:hypothetical protein